VPDSRDAEFTRLSEYQYLRAVYDATAAAYKRVAGYPVEVASIALWIELRERGIEPDREAVDAGAVFISRGEKPPILRPGHGRRRRRPPFEPHTDSDL
jgi:hypothetical protein